jgi:bifunctional non-homologous end joining protein LigD
MLQRTLPAGFIAPCLPSKTDKLPSGSDWLHEIKHDGFRVIARKNAAQVKLYSRPGNDLTHRFPLIVETLARLRSRSCIIDGEAVACDDDGVTSFNRVRYRRYDESIFLYAFDLIELNGDDLRPVPLEGRKATLEMILAKAGAGIRFNAHMEGDGGTVFRHACKLGLEGIVSKTADGEALAISVPGWRDPRAQALSGADMGYLCRTFRKIVRPISARPTSDIKPDIAAALPSACPASPSDWTCDVLLRLYVFDLNNARYSARPYNEGRRFQSQLIAVNARIEYAIVPSESLI